MTKNTWTLIACAGLVAGGIALTWGRGEPNGRRETQGTQAPAHPSESRLHDAETAPEGARVTAANRTPSIAASSTASEQASAPVQEDILRDDAQLTSRLADLRKRDPELALEMTRAVLEREPNHPDVPERNWIVIRALVDLKRRDEAKREARELVRRFPKSQWALDAERHLLVQP